MFTFQVNDMTCGHCVRSITEAVANLDQGAKVDIDLGQHLVTVRSRATRDEISRAIQEAGYHPTVLQGEASGPNDASDTTRRSGGCCR